MNYAPANLWPDERTAKLRVLWAEGLSCSEIAYTLGGGITRNAVIGKVHRLKLEPRRRSFNPLGRRFSTKTKKAVKLKPKPKRPRMILISKAPTPEPEPVVFSAEVWEPLPGTTPIPLTSLSEDVCRWPVGGSHTTAGTGFCGCPVARGQVYCPEHYARSVGKGTPSERVAVKAAATVVRFERQVEFA